MSRISGIFSAREGAASLVATAKAVAGRLGTETAHVETVCQEGCALAWAGTGIAATAQTAGISAVVDGVFYNAGELEGGASAGPAAQLIAGYRRHGFAGALSRINGDFAVALHDSNTRTLWLGRDRVGMRPLYYSAEAGRIAFASRPDALRCLPWISGAVNERFVAVFAGSHYRYIDNRPDESPFLAVKQLPAATVLEVRGQTISSFAYWQLHALPEWTESEGDLAGRYRDLLLDAVHCRTGAARQPAFTLSGGMDSSSVLACAALGTGHKQHAFSSVYVDKTYDESDDIKGFVTEKVSQWHPISIEDFDLFDVVRRMVRAHGEPVATATWLSHFLLCEQVAKGGFDVLFGGLGGDELNAGEYEYFIFHFADLQRQAQRDDLAHEIQEWARHHDHPIYRKNAENAVAQLQRLTDPAIAGRVRVEQQRFSRYFGAVRPDYFDLRGFTPILDHPFSSWLLNRTYQDIFRETAPCCLRAEDRDCAAFGLGHADPFFDHRLIEFMFRVPGKSKIRDGITKRLLREAMRGILPEETRTRIKKTGWNAPAHLWFNETALDQLLDLVHSRVFRERGIYDVNEVLRIIAEHRAVVASGAARENHMMFLWQLVNLELWFQEVVDQPSGAVA